MSALTKKKLQTCAATKTNGAPCTQFVLTDEGAAKLLDKGISLVANPTAYCSWHGRTVEERHEMAARGGSRSPKREAVDQEPEERKPMPDEFVLAAKTLIRELLAATIPNVIP